MEGGKGAWDELSTIPHNSPHFVEKSGVTCWLVDVLL